MDNYQIVLEPEGKNDGKNEGGLIVSLTSSSHTQEVSRVGFIRRNSANPKNSFEHQLDLEIGKARKAAQLLNDQLAGAGTLA